MVWLLIDALQLKLPTIKMVEAIVRPELCRDDNRLLAEYGKNEQRSNRTYAMYYGVQVDT
jgi:hypothetical protein